MQLRPYQQSVVDATLSWIRYKRGVPGYATAPGGSGKSVMIAKLAEKVIDQGLATQVVILARNEKLLRQNFAKLSPTHQLLSGIYCSGLGEHDLSKPVTVASIQSISKLGHLFKGAVILCDEAHNITAGDDETQYWQFFDAAEGCQIIGFTATPFRTRGGRISWGEEIINIPLQPLFQQGYLVPPVNKAPITPDLEQVPIRLGEFVQQELEEVFTDPTLLHKTIEAIIRYCEGGRRNHVIIFTQSLKHSALLEAALRDNGIDRAVCVDKDTDKDELADILAMLGTGGIRYVINCQLLKEGVDVPEVDAVVVVRSTMSKTLWEQMLYRGTRPAPEKKDFLVLDMGSNFQRHGGLGTPYRGNSGRESAAPAGKICPRCELFIPGLGHSECPDCGFAFPDAPPRMVNHEGEPDMHSAPVYAGDEYHEVSRVTYNLHVNRKKGTKTIRVDYHCIYEKFSEWLSPFSDSAFARNKCWQFFAERGRPGTRAYVEPLLTRMDKDQMLELLIMEAGHLRPPSRILVDKSEKFPRIKAYDWSTEESRSSDPESLGALLEGDAIPF